VVKVVTSSAIKTLVIGGAGYIGAHLVPLLLSIGRDVTILGRANKSKYDLPRDANYIIGDFSEIELLSNLLDTHQEVIHLAYATVPNTSFSNPLEDLLQNLPATVQLFSKAAERGVKLVLVSSGGTVYGEAIEPPIRESHPTKPISPYGLTKLTLENYAYLYAATHGLRFVCVRPANAFGVGQMPFSGQGFISTAMASVIKGLPIKIFGESGAVRDYVYITDIASGIVRVLQHGRLTETYNLGSGIGISNISVVERFAPLMRSSGYTVSVENLPERAFDVKINVLDSSKVKEHTGWLPEVNFDEGLRYTFEWLKTVK
jgi:UDP-glucose 4-epimerase